MMDFGLSDEEKMIVQTVREFTDKEIRPLLPEVQKAEIRGERFPDRATVTALQQKAKVAGLWGLQTPEEYGGANLNSVLNALIAMELGRSLVSFNFGGNADNILFAGTDQQKQRYLLPTIEGERHSCFALSEPNTGSDAKAIRLKATWEADKKGWIVNGAGVFLDRWAAEAIRCGWIDLDVFGVNPDRPDARFDCMGLVLLLDRAEVAGIDRDGADLVAATGASQRYRRRPVPADTISLWELAGRPASALK